jgi:hypothetical protein
MVRYRRNRVQGGTYFFTVTLADHRSTALVDHIDMLRAAFRTTRQERPFTVDAIVILPIISMQSSHCRRETRISLAAGGGSKGTSAPQ